MERPMNNCDQFRSQLLPHLYGLLDPDEQREVKDAEGTQQELLKLVERHQDQLTKLQNKIDERELNVLVSGPERIQPGTNNQFQIQTLNNVNRPVAANLTTRVRDEANQVVF